MAHDVFISHSSKDKTVADSVCATLENGGIRCWVAPRDVQPGRSFAGEIKRAIQNSKVMVLIFSAHSNNSDQVLREVQLAVSSHLHIVQFRIEEVVLNDDLSYFLGTPHWLDAITPPLEAHLQRLTVSIKALLAAPEEAPTEGIEAGREKPGRSVVGSGAPFAPAPRPAPSFLQDKRKLISAAAVAVFALLLIFWFTRLGRPPSGPEITRYTPAPPALPEYSVGPQNPPRTSRTVYPSAEDIYRQQTQPSVAPESEIPVRRRLILQHDDGVNDAVFTRDGKYVVTASKDHSARIWDVQTGKLVGEPLIHSEEVQKIFVTPDSRRIVTVCNTEGVSIWDATTHQRLGQSLAGKDVVTATLSPDGKRIAITEQLYGDPIRYSTKVWDVDSRKTIGNSLSCKYYVGDHLLAFSPDGQRIVTNNDELTAQVWDVESGNRVGDLLRHKGEVGTASFSPDGKALATWADQTKARVWDVKTGEQLLELESQTGDTHCQILYSPDGKYIAAIRGQNYSGLLFDAKSGSAVRHEIPLAHPPALFSLDGKELLTYGSYGGDAASIWNVETGQILSRKIKHDGAIAAMRFSPDGKVLVTASADHTARVWEVGGPTEPVKVGEAPPQPSQTPPATMTTSALTTPSPLADANAGRSSTSESQASVNMRTVPLTRESASAVAYSTATAMSGGNIDSIVALYGDRVDYLDQGTIGTEAIRREFQQYFSRWPQTSWAVSGPVDVQPVAGSKYKVTFPVSFTAANSTLNKRVSGTATETLVVAAGAGEPWKIVFQREAILRGKTQGQIGRTQVKGERVDQPDPSKQMENAAEIARQLRSLFPH